MRPPSTRSVGRRPLVLVLLALARQAAALIFEGQIARFASRRELPNVRKQRLNIEEQLESAVHTEDYVLAAHLRDDLAELRQKDPVVMASALRDELSRHISGERYDDAARCRDRLLVLRRFLPQYQLAGLWKGNYPNHGDELVRLHYDRDQLIATKVTGDEHVPAGEVTFRADLTDLSDGSMDEETTFSTGPGANVSNASKQTRRPRCRPSAHARSRPVFPLPPPLGSSLRAPLLPIRVRAPLSALIRPRADGWPSALCVPAGGCAR